VVYRFVHETLVFPELGIQPDPAVVAEARPKIELAFSVLEKELGDGRRFVVNETPTLADYMLLPNFWSMSFTPEGQAIVAKYPRINEWIKRMSELPAIGKLRASMPPRQPVQHARRWAVDHRAKAS
jgi:glutathione S-transferase